MGIITCHPLLPSQYAPLQSRGRVDCGVVDIGTPCQRVEFHEVVLDLSAGVGGVHQVETLHVVGGQAEANSLPVPDNLGAVVDDVERDDLWDGWCVDDVVEVKLLARECDRAELEIELAIAITQDFVPLTGWCSRARIESEVSL